MGLFIVIGASRGRYDMSSLSLRGPAQLRAMASPLRNVCDQGGTVSLAGPRGVDSMGRLKRGVD